MQVSEHPNLSYRFQRSQYGVELRIEDDRGNCIVAPIEELEVSVRDAYAILGAVLKRAASELA